MILSGGLPGPDAVIRGCPTFVSDVGGATRELWLVIVEFKAAGCWFEIVVDSEAEMATRAVEIEALGRATCFPERQR